MEKNAVAAFLLMLRNFLQGHTVNQESLVQCQGPAIIGALLRKVRPREQVAAELDGADWAVSKDGCSYLLLASLETEWLGQQIDRTELLSQLLLPAGPQLGHGYERAHVSPAADGAGGCR